MTAAVTAARAEVGRPASGAVVGGYFVAAFLCWLAATIALVAAAAPLAAGAVGSPKVLLAVHLVTLGVLPLAVTGGALHILPVLLRASLSRRRGGVALPLLCAGPALAAAIAYDLQWLLWPAAACEAAGFAFVGSDLWGLLRHAPRGRRLLASRAGVLLSAVHAVAAFALGAALATVESPTLWGVPHPRMIAIHLHLAVIGWLTLLLVAVGRTLAPMLALAPAAPQRRWPVEELMLTFGLWLLVAGLVLDRREPEVAGTLLMLAALARLAFVLKRGLRERHRDTLEGPLLHLAVGLFFLVQASLLGLAMLLGLAVTPRRLVAYALSLVVGWAAGVVIGHAGKLLSLSLWTWWPPGPRPKQAMLYPRRVWLGEAVGFFAGVEIAVFGVIAESQAAVAAGGAVLVLSALAASGAAACTIGAGRTALAWRSSQPTA